MLDHRSISSLEQAHILVVVIQPLLEEVDRWCYDVLRQAIPAGNNSLAEEELPGVKSAVSFV